MKAKASPRRAGKIPDFWPIKGRKIEIPAELKDWVINQYLCQQTLSVYCDASIKQDHSIMAAACTYVINGTIQVKHQYNYPPPHTKSVPPWYAELKAIIFALNHFEKHMGQCANVVIYTDINEIERVLGNDKLFKKIWYCKR